MTDAPKITRGIRLPVMTQEEIEARKAERPDPLADIRAAAGAYMRPVWQAMDAARLLTPEERKRKEQERRLNDFVSPHELWGDMEAKAKEARQALAADIAAAMAQAQKSEPAQAEPATLPRDEADKPPQRGYTQARAVELAAVLDAIQARAHECGVPLVRSQWPGTKAEFRGFLKWYAPRLLWALPTDNDNLTDELRPHGVAFGKPGRARDKGKKIYQELFPDYPA